MERSVCDRTWGDLDDLLAVETKKSMEALEECTGKLRRLAAKQEDEKANTKASEETIQMLQPILSHSKTPY